MGGKLVSQTPQFFVRGDYSGNSATAAAAAAQSEKG
jgi:hypothetical protein